MNIVTITDLSSSRLEACTCLNKLQVRDQLEPSLDVFIAEQPKVIEGIKG